MPLKKGFFQSCSSIKFDRKANLFFHFCGTLKQCVIPNFLLISLKIGTSRLIGKINLDQKLISTPIFLHNLSCVTISFVLLD